MPEIMRVPRQDKDDFQVIGDEKERHFRIDSDKPASYNPEETAPKAPEHPAEEKHINIGSPESGENKPLGGTSPEDRRKTAEGYRKFIRNSMQNEPSPATPPAKVADPPPPTALSHPPKKPGLIASIISIFTGH